jgi:O-antigen/teichoic acid export membrane protein
MAGPQALSFRSLDLRARLSLITDPLYRGSLTLMANTGFLLVFGLAFWSLATHSYSAAAVGVFTGLTAGISLLSTLATIGLQITITRYITTTENPRALVVASLGVIATVGTVLCLVCLIAFGPHLPAELHLSLHGGPAPLAIAVVFLSAAGTVLDAGLVALRASHAVLFKNLAASIVKVGALLVLILLAGRHSSSGLLIAYSLGFLVSTGGSCLAILRRTHGASLSPSSFSVLRRHLPMTAGSYLATMMAALPGAVLPLVVLAALGPAQTAHFGTAFMSSSLIFVIPATVSGVFFAEASRRSTPLGTILRKAIRGTYLLLVPAVVVVVIAAPLILRVFGAAYASAGAGCLRVFALSAIPMGGTYMIDSLLLAHDRTLAYIFINGANAALIILGAYLFVRHGLVGVATGWLLAQVLSLLLGLILAATGRRGRHHRLTDGPEPEAGDSGSPSLAAR